MKLSIKPESLAKLEALKTITVKPREIFKKTKPESVKPPVLTVEAPKEEIPTEQPIPEQKVKNDKIIPENSKYLQLDIKQIKDLYKTVRKKFPNCFPPFDQPPKMLAIGIYQDLSRELKMGLAKARTFCRIYCSKKAYLELRAKGAPRHNLNGNVVGEV